MRKLFVPALILTTLGASTLAFAEPAD